MESEAEKPVIVHVNKAKNVMKKLQSEMKDIAPDALDDEDIINLRRKFVYECEKTFKDDEWRLKMYQALWHNAFYATIFVYRGAWKLNQGLKASEKENYKTFVDKTKAYLLRLMKNYPDLAYHINNSIGDIHRYSAEILKSSSDTKEAIRFYGRAVKSQPDHGHPFNQLGLLFRLDNSWKAIIMFLRAGMATEPYVKALENLKLIKSDYFDKLNEISLEYVMEMFNPFSRLILEEPKNKWNEALKTEVEEDKPDYKAILEAFAAIALGSLYAMVIDKGNEDRQKYLISAIADDFKLLFNEFSNISQNSSADNRLKRRFHEDRARRKAHNDDEEEDDDEEYKLFSDDDDESESEDKQEEQSSEAATSLDPILPLLALFIEWYGFVDTHLMDNKKPSVALRMTLQGISQLIMDTTNKYIDNLRTEIDASTSSAHVLWLLKTPGFTLPESFFYELIPVLLKSAETWTSYPIYFDRYYKHLGKNKDLSTMREMARLQLEHASTDDSGTSLPTHYLLEAEVIRTRLYVVKSLVNDKANVLVSKSTMKNFDRIKGKDSDARTAVRYLEEKTKTGEIKILSHDFDRSLPVAQAFLSTLENREDVTVLILMPGNQVLVIRFLAINREGVDKFFTRYSAMKRRIL